MKTTIDNNPIQPKGPSPKLHSNFIDFVEKNDSFTDEQKDSIIDLSTSSEVRHSVTIIAILVLWSAVAVFIESSLVGGGIFVTAVSGFSVMNFIPNILFPFVNAVIKYMFISWFDRDEKYFNLNQKLILTIPFFGAFLFIPTEFKKQPLLVESLGQYARYLKKKGTKYLLNLFKQI